MVGAVVVTAGGLVAGAGYHHRAGEPHAEVLALREAGPLGRGATLYCTLEPCCHHGRTPPCVDAIVAAGVARVVVACEDPNPVVAGKGIAALRAHGIDVRLGEGGREAARLNRPFFTAMRAGRPWVLAKIALGADGRVGDAGQRGAALSSAAANRRTQSLRAEVDAIAVGSGAVLADDPRLTCRDVYRERPLARVIFDRRLRLMPAARLFDTLDRGPLVVVTDDVAVAARAGHARRLESAGARLLVVPAAEVGAALRALLPLGIQSVLLEGGPTLHRAAFEAGVVDAVRVIVTPRMLGPRGVPWLSADEVSLPALRGAQVDPAGPDVIIEGDVYRTH
jgi:diaminohydroxyphosphoribosylaminopyrimidine deaminase/5-amino-6-(5-phosphoribosylamino)uracil reductase